MHTEDKQRLLVLDDCEKQTNRTKQNCWACQKQKSKKNQLSEDKFRD